LFRENLRFPRVFLLFPIGVLAIWLANAVRIALLVAVGSSISPEIAGMGFHAQAGWIAFTLISIGAIALTHQMPFFSVKKQPTQEFTKENNFLSAALLAPFLVQMAALMLTSAFSSDFDWLYPARIMAITVVIYYYRNVYFKLVSKWNWEAPLTGIAVFGVWMLLEPENHESGMLLSQNLEKLSIESATLWLIFRVLGSVIVIPLAEELVFRGYLIRKLIAKDFENISSTQFTWLSFLLSSLLFGLLHDRWLAGTLAGMGYAIVTYRRGNLSDAVIAHMTTNTLIAALVLIQGKWSLWA
jgi:exosortase E/protease (VPEID-CTERM system)